jgi:hypothetical protein
MNYSWPTKTPTGYAQLCVTHEPNLVKRFALWHQRTFKPQWLTLLDRQIKEQRTSKH